MSESISNTEQALGSRVEKFIETHAEKGLWWIFEDTRTSRQPVLPFQRVEFQSYTKTWLPEDVTRGCIDGEDGLLYKMDVYFIVSQAELQTDEKEQEVPGRISVMVTDKNRVKVVDRYDKLAVIEDGAYDGVGEDRVMRAVDSLMGALTELKSRDLFLAIGQRSCPE